MTKLHGWPPILLPFGLALMGSVVYGSVPSGYQSWGVTLPRLSFLPVIVAAINPGTRAAVRVTLASGLGHAVAATIGCGGMWLRALAETLLYMGAAVTAAKVSQAHASCGSTPRPLRKIGRSALETAFLGFNIDGQPC